MVPVLGFFFFFFLLCSSFFHFRSHLLRGGVVLNSGLVLCLFPVSRLAGWLVARLPASRGEGCMGNDCLT